MVVTNRSNNYGPWQYPEKLIPVVIQGGGWGADFIHGEWRDWLHADDH